jgi:nitrogen-specific signal transduction histidine kinase
VLAQVCEHTGWAFGHAYLPTEGDEDVLQPMNASYEHAPGRFKAFRTATQGLRIARGQGLVGRVYVSGQPEWTRGIDRELDAARAALAEGLGVATMAAFPILAGREVVGVLEFFSERVDSPGLALLDAMASIGTQLGRVLERERAARTLRESYRLLEEISNTGPTMVRLYDLESQKYVYTNERMAAFLGESSADLVDAPLSRLLNAVHPDDVPCVHQMKMDVEDDSADRAVAWQVRMRGADGAWRWIRTWSTRFGPTGLPGGRLALSMSIDVTDEVENEQRLRKTERLTSIGTLAAGIAHEVNNPLSSVIMTAQLLRRQGLDRKTNEMLDHIVEDARRCGDIVRNVQRFARQESSPRQQVDMNEVVRAARALARSEARRANVHLKEELAANGATVWGDATELEQVVVNLIGNAVHASARGQAVVVQTKTGNGLVHVAIEGHRGRHVPCTCSDVRSIRSSPRAGATGGTGLGAEHLARDR